MEQNQTLDVEKLVEQGKALLSGESVPGTQEEVKSTLESLGSEIEQVRYTEGPKLSGTGQAILKDLEEILIGGAEVTEAIPPETFLHAARAQQKLSEATKPEEAVEATKEKTGDVSEKVYPNLAKLLRMIFTSKEFRDLISDWSDWFKSVLLTSTRSTEEKENIGQVPSTLSVYNFKVSNEHLDKLIGMFEWVLEREEYQTALGYIFKEFSELSKFLGIESGGEEGESVVDKAKLSAAVEEMKLVGLDSLKAIENWTHRSVEDFKDHLDETAKQLKSDGEFRDSLESLGHFLSNSFTEPGYLNDRTWIREEARNRVEQVGSILQQKGYKESFKALAREFKQLVASLNVEPRTGQLKRSLRKLLEDLIVADPDASNFTDSFRLKTELVNDLGILVNTLLNRAKYIRIPDIEIQDEDLAFSARNIILDAAELVPQQFKMTVITENMVEKIKRDRELENLPLNEEEKEGVFVHRQVPTTHHKSPLEPLESSPTWQSHLKLQLKGIHGHCRNVHFHVRKRSGFPQITDEGLADLRVWGPRGMLVKVVIRPEWIKEKVTEKTIHLKETLVGT